MVQALNHQLLGLFHLLRAEVGVGAEADVLVGVVVGALGGADDEPSLAKVVQQSRLHGHANGVVQRQFQDSEAQLNSLRLDRQRAGKDQRVAVYALAGEVVFGNPDGVVAHLLHQFGFG